MGVYQDLNSEYVAWGGAAFNGDDTLTNYANHVDIYAGYGNDYILNNGGEVKIFGENGNDSIWHNSGSNVTIDGGLGDDSIVAFGHNISISGGFSGNDTIEAYFLYDGTILGGDTGDNLITCRGNNNTIIGSRGSDSIKNSGDSNIWGGSGSQGNDTLVGGYGQEIFWFGHDDGDDVFFNAGSNDVIFLYDLNTSHYAYANWDPNSSNLEVKFRGGASITVQCTEELSPVFQFGSGERFAFNRSCGYWQGA